MQMPTVQRVCHAYKLICIARMCSRHSPKCLCVVHVNICLCYRRENQKSCHFHQSSKTVALTRVFACAWVLINVCTCNKDCSCEKHVQLLMIISTSYTPLLSPATFYSCTCCMVLISDCHRVTRTSLTQIYHSLTLWQMHIWWYMCT